MPPGPTDLIWNDRMQDPQRQAASNAAGTAAVVGLYFAYMPLVLGISHGAAALTPYMGGLAGIWEGLALTLGLQFMVSMLPIFLVMIDRQFFTLSADVYSQARLQRA